MFQLETAATIEVDSEGKKERLQWRKRWRRVLKGVDSAKIWITAWCFYFGTDYVHLVVIDIDSLFYIPYYMYVP